MAVVYAPFLQKIFRTVPLGATDWLFIAGAGLAGFAYIEIHKAISSRASRKNKN